MIHEIAFGAINSKVYC